MRGSLREDYMSNVTASRNQFEDLTFDVMERVHKILSSDTDLIYSVAVLMDELYVTKTPDEAHKLIQRFLVGMVGVKNPIVNGVKKLLIEAQTAILKAPKSTIILNGEHIGFARIDLTRSR